MCVQCAEKKCLSTDYVDVERLRTNIKGVDMEGEGKGSATMTSGKEGRRRGRAIRKQHRANLRHEVEELKEKNGDMDRRKK